MIGVVANRPREIEPAGTLALLLLTLRCRQSGNVDRHPVVLRASCDINPEELVPGATIYVEGYLGRPSGLRRVCVVAERAWSILAPLPMQTRSQSGRSHASPHQHRRAGHARRIAIGTQNERVVWVRPTTVHPRQVREARRAQRTSHVAPRQSISA